MTVETLTIHQGSDKLEMTTATGNWVLAREKGYSPVQMLVSAVAACGGYVYASVLENSKSQQKSKRSKSAMTETTTKKPNQSVPSTFSFYAKIAEADDDKATRCLKLVSPNCPVIQSLDPAIEVTANGDVYLIERLCVPETNRRTKSFGSIIYGTDESELILAPFSF